MKLKTIIPMLLAAAISVVGFQACKQANLKPEGLQMSSNPENGEKMYRINGTNQTIAESQLKTLGDEINVFPGYNGQRLVFTSDENLRTWANTQNQIIRNTIINKLDSIAILQSFATQNGLLDDLEATERYIRDTYGEPSTEAVVGVGLVFDGGNCGGNSMNLALPLMPSLFWMNNRTSSFAIAGSKVFCDKTWYRGTKWWHFLPPNVCRGLVGTNQDNKYESAL
jgi:hypothetical protein